ncbi:MAG: hypothetical protein JRH01_09755 [Deltaproteobacteria bacterium]|nr:hypothetical protein [Deltaproteobacteria bacterium]MBW2395736.1 hypothetical protein [Deltaproteobacteria bacterium]
MRTTDDFELIESVSADALVSHPVWSHWAPEVDRERVLAWGVAEEELDRQIELFESCGPVPLYPVLDLADLGDRKDLVVATRFEAADGARLWGYLLEPHAFGIFHLGEEYSFNRNLPAFSEREAERLAAALGTSADMIFPLFFHVDDEIPVTAGNEGEITRFW